MIKNIRFIFVFIVATAVSSLAAPLIVHPDNPRYFSDDSSRAILLTGSHTWLNLIDGVATDPPPPFDYSGYLDFLAAHNHNFFRLWTWEQARWVTESGNDYWFSPQPYERTGPGLAIDGKLKFDLSGFNQVYFDRLRQRVIDAGNRGIYVSVMLFDGWSIGPKAGQGGNNPWNGHPFNSANNINSINGDPDGNSSGVELHSLQDVTITTLQEAYIRKVVDAVNDLDNVLYEISNESEVGSAAWQYYMINYIKSYEAGLPAQHPVGMTVAWPNGSNADLYASPADWISPNGSILNRPIADGSKVIIADTDHLCGICGDRSFVWKSFLAGENPIFMDQYDDSYLLNGGGYNMNNSKDVLLRKNMGYIRTYSERVNLAAMIPRPDLASTSHCLADSGNAYIVYSTTSAPFTVNLSGVSGEFTTEWFDPTTGNKQPDSLVVGGGVLSFNPPFASDAVLLISSDSGCCTGLRGNVDDDPLELVDIGDLTSLIDYLFISNSPPHCMQEADLFFSDSNGIDISDVTFLISYLFIVSTPLPPCP